MASAEIDPRTFRHVLGQFCTGITIITTLHDDAPSGFACQSFAALSLEPPLVLFGFFVLYSLSGYVMAALRYLRPAPSPTQTP